MRIAFLTHEPFFPPSGGGSAEAVYLVGEFVRRGHRVDVFCPDIEDAAAVAERFGIRLRLFSGWSMGRYTSLRTAKYLAFPPALERLVLRVARTETFDVLFSQHAISAVAAGRLRRRLGVPVVMNFLDCLTGFFETWPRYLMPRAVARTLVRYELGIPRRHRADGVLAVSDPLRDRFLAAGVPADRVRAIYYGYDAALFRRDPAAAPTAAPALIVMHGSFDRHHLGPIARDAVVSVARQRPDVRFRFVGRETPALQGFLRTVRAAAPGLRAEATGFTSYEAIPGELSAATLGITPYEPSTGTHCAFVAKTVEYLGLGLPVVSTPLEGAMRYYAGLDAVKFPAADGGSFAGAILDWLALSADARTAATAPATRKVARELDWPAICGRAAEFTEQIVAGAGSPENRSIYHEGRPRIDGRCALRNSPPMADTIHPRSPRETMCGWMHLPRFIDKIRLYLAGRLDPEYQPNLGKGFDGRWLEAAGVKFDEFMNVVKGTITDGEVADWVLKNVKKSGAEKAAHAEGMLRYPTADDAAGQARLKLRKDQSGLGARDDILTFVDYIDADEKRF